VKALITGATSGIGEALAKLLIARGHEVIPVGRTATSPAGPTFQADLATVEGRQAVVDLIHRELPDLVVNAAGFGLYGAAVDQSTETQLEVLEVDAIAVYQLSIEAAKGWIATGKKGTVLNVSSVAAFFVFPFFSSYAAAKACVNSFSQALDDELREHGIRVLTACPGMVATRFQARSSKGSLRVEGWGVMDAEEAARRLWEQVEKKKTLSIFHWPYRIGVFFRHLLPQWFLSKRLRANIAGRLK
jgi:uncharacterized protein